MSGWQTKFSVSPGPGLWSLVLGPFGPDLGPDLELTWDLDLDLSLTIVPFGIRIQSFSKTKNIWFSEFDTYILYSVKFYYS